MVRMDAGREKYGDAHLQRYGLVDVMEECLDASNISRLAIDRADLDAIENGNVATHLNYKVALWEFVGLMGQAINKLREIDTLAPDALCTDERGGERVFWSEVGE